MSVNRASGGRGEGGGGGGGAGVMLVFTNHSIIAGTLPMAMLVQTTDLLARPFCYSDSDYSGSTFPLFIVLVFKITFLYDNYRNNEDRSAVRKDKRKGRKKKSQGELSAPEKA